VLMASKRNLTDAHVRHEGRASSRGRRSIKVNTSGHEAEWMHWQASPRARSLQRSLTPQQHARCAFVGNGFSLRCGPEYGAEIDAHEAIFRANGAQFDEAGIIRRYELQVNASKKQIKMGHQFLRFVRRNSVPSRQAGSRTDYRVSCLVNSAAMHSPGANETCIVPRRWWGMAWGKESLRNTKYLCCDDADWLGGTRRAYVSSSYSLANLQRQEVESGSRFAFFTGSPPTGEGYLDALSESSGGSALMAAISLCSQPVAVFGAGLYSDAVDGDKRYLHMYDHLGAALCVNATAAGVSPYRFKSDYARAFRVYGRWRRDRLVSELLLHIWNAFGVIHWRQ